MYKIITLTLKDMLRSFRSLFAVGMMVGAPLLITGLIYFAFSGMNSSSGPVAIAPLNVVIVNHDPADGEPVAMGKLLVAFLQDEAMPDWLNVTEMDSDEQARQAVDDQEAGVALFIPSDFTSAMYEQNGHTTLEMLQDPTLTIGPSIVRNLLDQFLGGVSSGRVAFSTLSDRLGAYEITSAEISAAAVMSYQEKYTAMIRDLNHGSSPAFAVRSPVSGESAQASTVTENPMAKILASVMAGMLVFFSFFTGANTTTSLLKEQAEGTLARLFTTPTPRTAILAGKFLAVFMTVIVQALAMLVLSSLLFKISWGNPATVALVTTGQVAAASGLGIFLISFIRNERQAGPVLGGLLTALGMVGGLFTTGVSMPEVFNQITLITPHGWAMQGWRLAIAGAAPQEVLLSTGVLLAIGAALFIIGSTIFRKRFA